MDHPHLHINREWQQSMIDVSANYTFGAFKVSREHSLDVLVTHVKENEIEHGYQTICDDGHGSRWIILTSNEDTQYNALGPFSFKAHLLEIDTVNMVTVIRLNENELVQSKGFGTSCFDSYLYNDEGFWVIFKKPIDYSEGPSVPTTIPICPQEVEGSQFYQASRLIQLPTESNLQGSEDGTNRVLNSQFEGLVQLGDVKGLESPHGDDVLVVERSCSCTQGSFCEKCSRTPQTLGPITLDVGIGNIPTVKPQGLDSGTSSSEQGWKISPNSVLKPHASTSVHAFEAPWIMDTGPIEDLPMPMSNEAPQLAFAQGSSEETFHYEETIEAPSRHEEMEYHVPDVPIATTSTNPRKRKVSKPKAHKHHGVIRRQGGRESFVAYFRPKSLPESDKKFVTLGEFTNESDAWHAFNLFALVHEGEESCMNINDEEKESLEYEVDVFEWRELPRVDLLAFLRRKGRGFFKDLDLQDVEIPKYRNVKFYKNKRGKHKGKIRWFCDVMLEKGIEIQDPKVVDIIKSTSTFDTAEEAARKADKLMIVKEAYMAWTNFTITDYLTEVEKEQWDKLWIPLDDNPRKYLSTSRY